MREIYSFCELSKSFTSTSRHLAICLNVSSKGRTVLVHRLETVARSLSKASANHFSVRFFTTSTTLILLISLLSLFFQFY